MDKKEIFCLLQDVFAGLEEGGVLEEHVELSSDTVLAGTNAVLDSIAFVTLFTDIEERLEEKTGKEIFLLIDEVHEFNPEGSFLTVGVLLDYIENLLK